ncbi:MAG: hypothetical protein KDD56_03850 [Bdellovibrionales bacterium]|nr:hypothetical protein [Bdellovibrionales bacterium]
MKRIILSLAILAGLFSLATTKVIAEVKDAEFEQKLKTYLGTEQGKELIGGVVENYFREKQQQAAKLRQEREAKEVEDQFKNPVKLPF